MGSSSIAPKSFARSHLALARKCSPWALPPCQILLGSVDLHPRYGGSNLRKSPFYAVRTYIRRVLRQTDVLDQGLLWCENKARGLYHSAKFGWGRLTPARDMGVQTCENRHFTPFGHIFVLYCAKMVRSIPSCFKAKK